MLRKLLNFYGEREEDILFIIDFEAKNFFISPIKSLPKNILFEMDAKAKKSRKKIEYTKYPISFDRYKKAFFKVKEEIKKGNTYLLNLTFASKIKTNLSLKEIYTFSDAKYKLYFKDKFVCFSPETFIEIKNNKIYTYPMKGTIDAKIKNAKEKILNNQKEMAEHTMVVDLLRNDLSIVAKKVRVEKFRYIEKIRAGDRELLQVSSKISGELENNWNKRLGDILLSLLPAGSISGTPKKSTVEIIKKVENYDRGFFTGIFGIYEKKSLKSAVMIRFIEKIENEMFYKSGGGITIDSDLLSEYQELQDKIYVPFV